MYNLLNDIILNKNPIKTSEFIKKNIYNDNKEPISDTIIFTI
jgi:hypothetical protein